MKHMTDGKTEGIVRFCMAAVLLAVLLLTVWILYQNFRKRTFVFHVDDSVLYNPLTGYAPQAEREDFYPESTLVYLDITWRELEPEEGQYDWAQIEEENHLQRWKSEGKHAVLRFLCDYPSEEPHRDIPDWLYEKTGGAGTEYDMEYGKGFAPDYTNEVLIENHEKVIRALGDYFGQDSFISYIELGSLGHWGEWHVNYSAGIQRMPKSDIRARYVTPYTEAFPNARLLMRRPFAEMPDECGLYNDMAGDPDSTSVWLDWIEHGGEYGQAEEEHGLKALPEFWKTAPAGGEFTSGISMEELLVTEFERTKQLLEKSHTTFLGPKIPDMDEDGEVREQALRLLASMGYRYRITEMTMRRTVSGDMLVTLTWTNDGCAPIYWDWMPCLYVTDDLASEGVYEQTEDSVPACRYPIDLDLTTLLPGECQTVSLRIPKKVLLQEHAMLWAGVENPDTGRPEMYLAIQGERLGTMSLLWKNQ